MSSFAKQTRFPAPAFRHRMIISSTIKAETFFQENFLRFLWIRDFGAFVWLVICAVAVNTSTITRTQASNWVLNTFESRQVLSLDLMVTGFLSVHPWRA